MSQTVERSIEVHLPVRTVYDQWTQFEEFPRFMEGVREVRQIDEKRLHWRAEIAGRAHEWDVAIVEQTPDHRIAWRCGGDCLQDGAVTFEARDGGASTLVTLRTTFEPTLLGSDVADPLDIMGRQAEGNLQRFRATLEQRGQATGAWRGEIHGGQVEHDLTDHLEGAREPAP